MIQAEVAVHTSIEIGIAVWVSPISPSLSDSSWKSRFRGSSLLEYCIQGLTRQTSYPLIVVCPTAGSKWIREIGARHNVAVEFVESMTPLAGFGEALERMGWDRMLIVHGLFGLGFVPANFLNTLTAEHGTGTLVTIAKGLPLPMYAAVCELEILREFVDLPPEIPVPNFPEHALETIMQSLQHANGAGGHPNGLKRVSFADHFGLVGGQFPKQLPWTSPKELALLDEALQPLGEDTPTRCLSRLQKLLVRHLADEHRPRAKRRVERRTLRVLFASNPSAYSGSEQCLINTVKAIRGEELEPHCLVALEGTFTQRLRQAGAIVHCPQADFATPNVANIVMVSELLDRLKPDLIHCNAHVGPPLLAASLLRGIPLLQWVRLAETDRIVDHLLSADRVTAVSRFVAGEVSAQPIEPQKICVLYDPVDCDYFSPGHTPKRNFRKDYGIGEHEFLVVCVARFAAYKRHDILIEAVSAIRATCSRIRLVIVGEPQPGHEGYYRRMLALLDQRGLRDTTLVLDFQEDILEIESAADAIVLCSVREPLGTVVLEGMALERPVIVTNSGGLPEVVQHECSGLHCDAGDPESLALQLRRLYEDRELGIRLGANARIVAIERFSLQVHRRKLCSIYKDLFEA